MKKSREFNNVLDECVERLLVKSETLEQCLRSFPRYADELKPLLETALATKRASAIQPRPEFRDRARNQFYSAFQETERKRSYPLLGWWPRWATVVAIVLVLLLAGSGTVAAAGGSMPDEPLYSVKLATEQVQLAFTPSALGKAELYAKLADKRVLEIVCMASESKPEHIEQIARRLDTCLTKIVDLASTQEIAGGVAMAPAFEKAPIAREAPAVEEAPPVEEALTFEEPSAFEKAPVREEPTAEGAQGTKEAPLLAEQAREVKEARIAVDRRARLRATVIIYAKAHPECLRALLKTVPESAKPAVLRAIAISETGYEKALKSLD